MLFDQQLPPILPMFRVMEFAMLLQPYQLFREHLIILIYGREYLLQGKQHKLLLVYVKILIQFKLRMIIIVLLLLL